MASSKLPTQQKTHSPPIAAAGENMPDIALTRQHHLGLKGAKAAADKMVSKLDEKFDLSGDWKGNTLSFSRPGVTGSLTVSETEMMLEVTLGFMLKMMKAPIEKAVHEQLEKVMNETPAAKPAAKPTAKPAAAKKPTAAKKKSL
jgi:putative polyhydroxyalkanoate system protein